MQITIAAGTVATGTNIALAEKNLYAMNAVGRKTMLAGMRAMTSAKRLANRTTMRRPTLTKLRASSAGLRLQAGKYSGTALRMSSSIAQTGRVSTSTVTMNSGVAA